METKRFDVPALYGDHHVSEVRRILLALEGVTDVYASSAFQVVEVTYDEARINDLQIALKLDEAGYLGEWTIPIEMGVATQQPETHKTNSRHTATYETTKHTISFVQRVNYEGRPLWPCPGMGTLQRNETNS